MKKFLSYILVFAFISALFVPASAVAEPEVGQLYHYDERNNENPYKSSLGLDMYESFILKLYIPGENDSYVAVTDSEYEISVSGANIGTAFFLSDLGHIWETRKALPNAEGSIVVTNRTDSSKVYALPVTVGAAQYGLYADAECSDYIVPSSYGFSNVLTEISYTLDYSDGVKVYLQSENTISILSSAAGVTLADNLVTVAPASAGVTEFTLTMGTAEYKYSLNFGEEVPAPDAGLYLSESDGMPSGECISSVTENNFTSYPNFQYNSAEEKVFYYYNQEANLFTFPDRPNGLYTLIENVGNSGHFWKITLRAPQAGYGNFDLNFSTGNGNFPISFVDTYVRTYTKGLYYLPLSGVNENNPSVNTQVEYSNAAIHTPLYEGRMDIVTFFYDGEDFVPVEVKFSETLAVDVVTYDDPGWYVFMPYDFGDGTISYVDDNGTPDNDADDTEYSINIFVHIPEFAFYDENNATADNYRMYTFASKNISQEEAYKDYKYVKQLYLLPLNPEYCFDESAETFAYCEQRKYLPNGMETDSVAYTDFKADIQSFGDGGIKGYSVTVYTNDSDVLFFFRGELAGQWQFGSYVNILAPDDEDSLAFNMNNQGSYAAAKFLPKHVFDELAALQADVTLKTEGFTGGVICDKNMVGNIAAEDKPVTFYMGCDALNEEQIATVQQLLSSGEQFLDALEFKLYFGETYQHDLGGNNAKATIHYEVDLPNNTTVRIYYLNDDGGLEEMTGEYRNGKVIFSSNHFSSFVLTTESAPVYYPPYIPPVVEAPEEIPHGFTDVQTGDWYADAVQFNFTNKYVTGVSESSFEPYGTMTRGMMMTLLARINGVDTAGGASWFEKGVGWAVSTGVSDGTAIERQITREEMITMLWRALGSPKAADALGSYKDSDEISSYCADALNWAVSVGLVKGVGNDLLDPAALTNRAQAAQLIYNYYA